MASRCRAFQFQLLPTVKQSRALTSLLAEQCRLYNAALEERRGAWRLERRSVSRFEQYRTLTGMADQEPALLSFGVTVARGTLLRLDRAFANFFRRVAAGERPGFPRFRPAKRFDSAEWPDVQGWKIDAAAGRLYLQGVGHVKMRMHRQISGTPKTITVARVGRRWQLTVFCADVPSAPLPDTGKSVGVDVGVTVAVALSDGRLIDNPRHIGAREDALTRAQRLVASRCQGSRRRSKASAAVTELHRRVRAQRRDFLHKQSRILVNEYDVIVMDELQIRNMTRRPKPIPDGSGGFAANKATAKAELNKSILDVGWGHFQAMVAYKAEEAGRQLVVVNPRRTSQTCAACGYVHKDSRKGTVFRCVSCGHRDHADVNAAVNILRAGLAQRPQARSEPKGRVAIRPITSRATTRR
jgi:putative transposase